MERLNTPPESFRDDRPVEILYKSTTTHVFRHAPEGAGVVFKEMLGSDAPHRLRHEISVLKRLSTVPGIVRLARGSYAPEILALQDCDGVALSRLLESGPVEPPVLVPWTTQLAQSLADMHRAGVIHRDLNPSNILVTSGGALVLIDFDLALFVDRHPGAIDREGLVGTLGYLAPEQTGRTGNAVDQRADLYALGATLYELATGRPPFVQADALQLIHDHLVRDPVAPSQLNSRLPRALSHIILRLLAKAPESRYQSAEGLLHDLERFRIGWKMGGDAVFELGERDFPSRLAAPDELVGRESEMMVLRAAFNDAMLTPRRTILIDGAAGVGKSAIVDALRPLVAAAGGWFVQGKFDQFQRDAATSGGVTRAYAAFGRLLLAQPRDELAALRRRVLDSLGRHAGLMTRIAPEFAILLGPQPVPPEVDPRQAELQVHHATVDMLRSIISADRPLVVVLEDLQWAGSISLRCFERLMGELDLRGVLLVGTYRSDEVNAGQELAATLAQWREQPLAPREITLSNLGAQGMREFLAQMLRLTPEAAGELAPAVAGLTGGNPFDTVEIVNALRREGVLAVAERGWSWDSTAIRRFVGQGKVADLLAARVARLPKDSRELLELMCCLGGAVECRVLRVAAGLDETELQDRLRAPLDDGLLVSDATAGCDTVQFRHDRVQQAVEAAEHPARGGPRQLAMARRLAAEPGFEAEAAEQYLRCADLLQVASERRTAASLFCALAQTLALRAAYLLAERYLAAADELLNGLEGPADASLRWSVDVARHAALYSIGRLDESDPLYAAMRTRSIDPLELVEATCLQMRSLDMRGRMGDAMQLGLAMLRQLGLDVPPDYADAQAEQKLDAINAWIARDARVHHASRAQIRDPRLLAIAKLLGRTVRSALVLFETRAIVWLLLESQRLWAEHGPCAELVASLGRMGSMLISRRQDYRTAYDIARHVLSVGEAIGWEPQTSEARFIFSTYACHWYESVEAMYRQVTHAYQGVLVEGDGSYAGYVHIVVATAGLELAPSLDVLQVQLDAGIAMCQRTGNLHAAMPHILMRQALRAMRGQTLNDSSFDDEQFNEQAFLAQAGRMPYIQHTHSECRAMHALVMSDAASLIRATANAVSVLGNLAGYYLTAHLHFFTAMARAWQLGLQPAGNEHAPALAELDASLQWLAGRAADQPHNFLHLQRLVEAERAWALGDLGGADRAFDSALLEVAGRDRTWHRAIITERAGLFHLARGMIHAGRELLSRAHDLYVAWGATAKGRRLREEHPYLQTAEPREGSSWRFGPDAGITSSESSRGSRTVSSEALDLMGVVRASQALSSETSLEPLTARVTEVLATLSGATKVLVLLWREDEWWLLTPAPGESAVPVGDAARRGLLPLSVVRYTEVTGAPLLVDDARRDDRFARDPYFERLAACSLLVVPISGQGNTRAMLLLQNELGRAAFHAQRLDAVMLIAGQLAVSLGNAQVYKEVGMRLGLAEITVKSHLTAIFRLLGVVNRTQAVVAMRRLGLDHDSGQNEAGRGTGAR